MPLAEAQSAWIAETLAGDYVPPVRRRRPAPDGRRPRARHPAVLRLAAPHDGGRLRPLPVGPRARAQEGTSPCFVVKVAGLVLRAVRWKAVGEVPQRGVLVGAPHTSNWDWVLTMLLAWRYGITIRLLVKQELFVGPLGWLLRRTGAVELDRRNPGGDDQGAAGRVRGRRPVADRDRGGGHALARRLLEVRLLPDRPADRPPDHAGLPRRALAHRRLGSDVPPDGRRQRRHGPRCASSTPTRPASSPRASRRRGCARRAEASPSTLPGTGCGRYPKGCGRFPRSRRWLG